VVSILTRPEGRVQLAELLDPSTARYSCTRPPGRVRIETLHYLIYI